MRGLRLHPYKETKEVAEFCSVCDFYEPGKPCKIVGEDDQARYVRRDWCGWANVRDANISVKAKVLEFIFPDDRVVHVPRDDEEKIEATLREWKEKAGEE